MAAGFYVYEHLRGDTQAVFYVGKGSGDRCKSKQGRNRWWHAIAAKHGYQINIRVRMDSEELAYLAEQELIERYKRLGVSLVNATEGGEGMTGHKWSPESIQKRIATVKGRPNIKTSLALKGVPKSEEHRRNLSLARIGMRASEETRARMSATRKGRPGPMRGKTHLSETKAKISSAISGEKNPFFGRTHSELSRQRMSASHSGVKASDETRARMSAARTGENNPRFGKPIPEDQKARQIAALKARPRVSCPHCSKVMDEANAKRWHLDNCREKT